MKEFLEQPKIEDTKRIKEFLVKMKSGTDWHDMESVKDFRTRFINEVYDLLSLKISREFQIDLTILEKHDLMNTIKEVLLIPTGKDKHGIEESLMSNVAKDVFKIDLDKEVALQNLNHNIDLFTEGTGAREIKDRFFENTWGIELERLFGPHAGLKQDTGNPKEDKQFYLALKKGVKNRILQARMEQNTKFD